MEERIAILSSDLGLFRDVREIVQLAECGELQKEEESGSTSLFKNLGIFGKLPGMSSASPQEEAPDLMVDFVAILQNKESLKNHVSSNMSALESIHFSLLDLDGSRAEELASILHPDRKQQADDFNKDVKEIIELLNTSQA